MTRLLEQIQANAITDIKTSHPAEDVIGNVNIFFEALEQNNTIETVRFEGEFIGDLRNNERSKLLKTLGKIPSLQEVHLEHGLLLVIDVTEMLVKAKILRALTMTNIVLQGIKEDFDACEAAIYQHPCLKEFDVEGCTPAVSGISLQKLLNAHESFANGARIELQGPTEKSAKTA
jgi:hypothetical protein